jgi:hypothetical protein
MGLTCEICDVSCDFAEELQDHLKKVHDIDLEDMYEYEGYIENI